MFEYHKFKPTPLLSPAERKRIELEDLRDKIDLALVLGQKQWFMELTDKLKEYEV